MISRVYVGREAVFASRRQFGLVQRVCKRSAQPQFTIACPAVGRSRSGTIRQGFASVQPQIRQVPALGSKRFRVDPRFFAMPVSARDCTSFTAGAAAAQRYSTPRKTPCPHQPFLNAQRGRAYDPFTYRRPRMCPAFSERQRRSPPCQSPKRSQYS